MPEPLTTLRPRTARYLRLAVWLGICLWMSCGRPSVQDPLAGAQWIWSPAHVPETPLTFFAVRDVELGTAPRQAHLAIRADQTYQLYINGRWVGAGGGLYGPEIDLYDVAAFLHSGNNRVLVEARSASGVGGLAVALTAGAGRWVSDGDWRILGHFHRLLFRPEMPLPEGEAPWIWGDHPTGRWTASAAIRRPKAGTVGDAVFARRVQELAGRRHPWQPLAGGGRRFPSSGRVMLFDWGEEVTGYLAIRLPRDHPVPALAFYGEGAPPSPTRQSAELVIPMPVHYYWQSSQARRFRYVLVSGLPLGYPPAVLPVTEAELERQPATSRGAFRIEPPWPHSQAEEQLWEELMTAVPAADD